MTVRDVRIRIRIGPNWTPPIDRWFPTRRPSDPWDAPPVGIPDRIASNVVGVKWGA